MKGKEILALCSSNPEAVVSYIENLDSLNHKEIIELCASNPEAIVSYIESHPMNNIDDFDSWLIHPKRPDLSLNLYKRNNECDFCGYVYNGNKSFNTWHVYAHGYLVAIKKLIVCVKRDELSNGLPCSDTIGYPIFYLFNHYLELIMKDIYRKGTPKENRNNKILISHNLVLLWAECEKIVQQMGFWEHPDLNEDKIKEYKTDREIISHFIKEIAQDTQSKDKISKAFSQAFRYPMDTEDKPFLVNSPMTLNISALSGVVDWLSYQLEGISEGMNR